MGLFVINIRPTHLAGPHATTTGSHIQRTEALQHPLFTNRNATATQLAKLTKNGLPVQSALALWRVHCNTDATYYARLAGISVDMARALDQAALAGIQKILPDIDVEGTKTQWFLGAKDGGLFFISMELSLIHI